MTPDRNEVPEFFYALAAQLSAHRLVAYSLVGFGLICGPLLAITLDEGKLYGVAVMAAGWWPVILLLKFHPQHRALSTRIEDWFYALVLDLHGLSVAGVVLFAATKK
jgi:hypothetical protein